MKSQTRQDCEKAVIIFTQVINKEHVVNKNNVLYVGIAGDPPGGEYSNLFINADVITFDIDVKWKPKIVGDITNTQFKKDSWDTIICVQVIEHVKDLFNLPIELHRIIKPNGYLIIDCPWNYPYHAEPPSFKDYWRISKDGMIELFNNFRLINIVSTESNTSCLFQKN